MTLEGKRILITGASRGLGANAAIYFSSKGAKLALIARSKEGLEKTKSMCYSQEDHLIINADLSDFHVAHTSLSAIRTWFSNPIDVILHCIGGGLGYKDYLLNSYELNKLFVLNIGIAAEINSMIAPDMIKRKSGNIVHVGSIASSEGVGSVGYNTVKAALAAYVRSLGRELAKHHVICTGILPGGFISPGNSMARFEESNPKAYNDFIINRLPREHMGQTAELLPILSVLCSEEASMMCGCMVPIDAGEGRAYVN